MLEANIWGANCNHKIDGPQLMNVERVSRTKHARVGRNSDVIRQEITNRRNALPGIHEIRTAISQNRHSLRRFSHAANFLMEPQITQMGADTSRRNSRSYVRVHQQNGCGQLVSSEAW